MTSVGWLNYARPTGIEVMIDIETQHVTDRRTRLIKECDELYDVGWKSVMTCPSVRPYDCAIYSISSSSLFLFFTLLSSSISLSHFLPWLEIHPGDSTIFACGIYLCVHDLSSASRLNILLVFCVL